VEAVEGPECEVRLMLEAVLVGHEGEVVKAL
jgi:hypothetical protein